MTGITNSSIQVWLDFDGQNLPASLPSCSYTNDDFGQVTENTADCTEICGSADKLLGFSYPGNMVTCGLWVTLITVDQQIGGHDNREFPKDLYTRFDGLGFNRSNITQAYAVRDAISTVLFIMEQLSVFNTYSGKTSRGTCSEQALFSSYSIDVASSRLQQCMSSIGAPPSLNPDIGGIGVLVSLLMQLCIAFLILSGILYLTFGRPTKGRRNRVQMMNLLTALVEFHKAQCYFISAFQVATLVVVAPKAYRAWDFPFSIDYNSSGPQPPLYDVFLSIPLSMNGFVPVTFTLSCISLYSRLSWHIIALTSIPLILSSGTLFSMYKWLVGFSLPTAAPQSGFVQWQVMLCGPKAWKLNSTTIFTIAGMGFTMIWLTYGYCMVWVLWCLIKHTMESGRKGSLRERIMAAVIISVRKLPLKRLPMKTLISFGCIILLLLWLLCFAFHFYLYSLFTRSHLVSPTWSLGQIIAVTVWVPSIVEYFYILREGIEEGSKYRYPPGVQAYII